MRPLLSIGLLLGILLVGLPAVRADDQTYTGTLDAEHHDFSTSFDLQAGESVYIAADATSGDLDPYLSLQNPEGVIVVENDDRDNQQLNAALGYTAMKAGTYTITLTPQSGDTSGDFRLKIIIGDSTVLDNLDTQAAEITLSGPALTLDTAHFRIHYTHQGDDSVTDDFVHQVAKTMEVVWQKEIIEMGWPAPPSDGRGGGDARMDVYLMDMLDDEGNGALGVARPGHQYGDNPNTAAIERNASTTLLRLDNDFKELSDEGDPMNFMHATAAHEFHHAIQDGYDASDLHWYAEATSVWMETQAFPKNQDATGYVDYLYSYPELCFGTENDPDEGLLIYGEWLFMQSLVDAHGEKAIHKLWSNIAQYDGFEALAQTLAFYDDSIPEALARYHIQNIVRDYKFAPDFDGAAVWLSDSITSVGRLEGYGVQELGANYIRFNPPKGTYRVSLEDDGTLEVWAVSIIGHQASAIPLGRDGTITGDGYDYVYLMVFNPAYTDDLDNCGYTNYHLDVSPSSAEPAPAVQTWDAKYFIPLKSD